jgi:hypothetical protein
MFLIFPSPSMEEGEATQGTMRFRARWCRLHHAIDAVFRAT